jgi:hypothetical protein
MLHTEVNVPLEISFAGEDSRRDRSGTDVDVMFSGPGGTMTVPAFWAGRNEFRVRFAAPAPGRWTYRTACTDASDTGLHGRTGEVEAVPYTGTNPLYLRGRIGVSKDRRTLVHRDGTPFFWLADTWWMGLCRRFSFPADFRVLAQDRVGKGFSVVQIVAGLYPDMGAFDERGANEAGFPWEKDWSRLNPSYFDMADLRIEWLVRTGLVPCIVACWGYYLPLIGVEKMKRHWRNLVARWGAYPVTWCLAGEGVMPYYLSKTKEQDEKLQRAGWTELARYVRSIDPYHAAITIHPTSKGREQVDDPTVIDYEMLQTGHSDRASLPNTIQCVTACYAAEPRMPTFVSEVCYEGIGESCRQEVQRMMFWSSVLHGACGHTYGANGIWQVNTREKPYGPSPHGMAWGHTPWEDAYLLPGSAHLGLARRLLERYEWWRFEPHPEWADPHAGEKNWQAPSAAGIPGKVRVIYAPLGWEAPIMKGLEPGVRYRAYLWNPTNGGEIDLGDSAPDASGDWKLPMKTVPWNIFPVYQDWVVVLEAPGARR